MSKLNVAVRTPPAFTHEGGRASSHLSPLAQLTRSVGACMLWEDQFYEDGASIADRITSLTLAVSPADAFAVAQAARERLGLRHAPLLIARAMAGGPPAHRRLVAGLLPLICDRPDQMTEFLAIYWKDKRQPLSAQVKKGLAAAFTEFSEYALAKYNRLDAAVKLKDILGLVRAKPRDEAQSSLWKRLLKGELQTPDTWEVELSKGGDKREAWEGLLSRRALGPLAFIRNLRNMHKAGVDKGLVAGYGGELRITRVWPFQFIAAARAVPGWEDMIEPWMLTSLAAQPRLPGRTLLMVDVSGSMSGIVSQRSALSRLDTAKGLAICLREVAEGVEIVAWSDNARQIPPRRGFALADAIGPIQGGTYLAGALAATAGAIGTVDRCIVITDEQTHDGVARYPATHRYIINVGSYKNGVGYGDWTHITGWSDKIIDYIRESEALPAQPTAETEE